MLTGILIQIISFRFFLDWSGGIALPSGEIYETRKVLANFSISLGVLDYNFFSTGASFNFVPSIPLFFPSAFVSVRFDSPSFSASGGGGLGPAIVFGKDKTRALLGFNTFLNFGNWIRERRLLGYISPGLSGFLGEKGGFIISAMLGFTITSSQR